MPSAEKQSLETCPCCGALPVDQVERPDLSHAITVLYTHGLITSPERDKARKRLRAA